MSSEKTDAFTFLDAFRERLRATIPFTAADMDPHIRGIVAAAKKDAGKKHLRLPEAAFLNTYVIPELFSLLKSAGNLSDDKANEALLNEYHRSMPGLGRFSAIHGARHPFRKLLGASPAAVYRQWLKPDKGDGLTQSAPDFAVRAPFQHKIVFEGKYFSKGSLEYAQKELACDLFQAFFYRGLPKASPKTPGRPGWDYDYACLLAFDASRDGTLLQAWNHLSESVKRSFWESANVYVMILRD